MADGLLAVLAKSCILFGPLVKRLRHGPFTAVTWVRFPYGSPKHPALKGAGCFSLYPCGLGRRTGIEQLVPAVQRTGGQKGSCGAFLERGRFPIRVTGNCSSSLGWRRFFCFRTRNCCAGDRRLRRMQGAGAGLRVAEGKPRPRGDA